MASALSPRSAMSLLHGPARVSFRLTVAAPSIRKLSRLNASASPDQLIVLGVELIPIPFMIVCGGVAIGIAAAT